MYSEEIVAPNGAVSKSLSGGHTFHAHFRVRLYQLRTRIRVVCAWRRGGKESLSHLPERKDRQAIQHFRRYDEFGQGNGSGQPGPGLRWPCLRTPLTAGRVPVSTEKPKRHEDTKANCPDCSSCLCVFVVSSRVGQHNLPQPSQIVPLIFAPVKRGVEDQGNRPVESRRRHQIQTTRHLGPVRVALVVVERFGVG